MWFVHSKLRKNKKSKETGDSRDIYQKEIDQACFQHDMAYEDFINLNRRTATDKALPDKAFNIAKNRKYDGYQRGSMVCRLSDRKSSSRASTFANAGVSV